MDFLVVGKRVVIMNQRAVAAPAPQQVEYQTQTVISCPPRSLTGLGSELLVKAPGINTLMEIQTTSSGGCLRALSGSVVWRTAGDFSRLAMEVAKTKFADGRLVWDVLPRLIISPDGPIAEVIKAKGKPEKLTNHMLTDIRDYVKWLVEAAERNDLPLCLLRHLLSFLGSPPGGATGPRPAPRHPPTTVWRTMTRLRELRLDSGLGGHARKRHHTSECAAVPSAVSAVRAQHRRRLSVPADLDGVLVRCDELSPPPTAADHPLDLHMADRTVRFCSRPAAAVWEGSEFSWRWRQELATQQRCRIVGKVTLITHTRRHLKEATSRRCLKQDVKRLLWKEAQQRRKLLRQQHQRLQHQEPAQKEEQKQPLPYPYPQGPSVLRFLGITQEPMNLGNNMLVFPPPVKTNKRSPTQHLRPKFKFGPRQRASSLEERLLQIEQLQVQQCEPQRGETVKAQVHYSNVGSKLQSPVVSAKTPKPRKSEHEPSPSRQAGGSPRSQQPSRRVAVSTVAREPGSSSGGRPHRPSLEEHRFSLLQKHFGALLQGRRPRQHSEKPLPPRSPLVGPGAVQPPPPPASASAKQQVIRPGLWLRLMGPLPAYTQGTQPSPPQGPESRVLPPQIQTTWPSLHTQKTEPSPSQAQTGRTHRRTPPRTQGKRLAPSQNGRIRATPSPTQRVRPSSSQVGRQSAGGRGAPSPSLWDRMTDRLGLARSQTETEVVEMAQEATEARVRAIVEYQSTLPPLWRVRLLEGGC